MPSPLAWRNFWPTAPKWSYPWGCTGRCRSTRALDLLAARSVAARVAETREAVRIYNDLTDGSQVAGLFHSTY